MTPAERARSLGLHRAFPITAHGLDASVYSVEVHTLDGRQRERVSMVWTIGAGWTCWVYLARDGTTRQIRAISSDAAWRKCAGYLEAARLAGYRVGA